MVRKNRTEDFRRQAVDLYESTPGATLVGIAADLGIVRGTLSHWVELYGTGTKTTVAGATISSPSRVRPAGTPTDAVLETPEAKIARLEAENAALRAETTKLATEREIPRQAATYFAGESNR